MITSGAMVVSTVWKWWFAKSLDMKHSAPMENEKLNVGRPSMRKKSMYCGNVYRWAVM